MREFLIDLGRIAVRWLLWSPKHAALGALTALVTLALAVALLQPAAGSRPAATGVDITETPVSSSVPATPTTSSPRPSTSPSATIAPAVAGVPGKFAAAYVYHHRSRALWIDGMTPYATKNLIRKLKLVDPAVILVDTVTGPPQPTAAADGRLMFTVPTGSYPLRLTLTRTDGRWAVDVVDLGSA